MHTLTDLAQALDAHRAQQAAQQAALVAEHEQQRELRRALEQTRAVELLRGFMGDAYALLAPEQDMDVLGRFTFRYDAVDYRVYVSGGYAQMHSSGSPAYCFDSQDSLVAALAEAHPAAYEHHAALLVRFTERAESLKQHAACEARIVDAKAAVVPWAWPEGRELVLYHWRWGDECEGWSLAGDLDRAGMVTLQPEPGRRARTLMLRYAAPVAEQWIVGSVEALPDALRTRRTVDVLGVMRDSNEQDDAGNPLLIPDARYGITVPLAYDWPIAWVRDALTR